MAMIYRPKPYNKRGINEINCIDYEHKVPTSEGWRIDKG